MKKTYVKARYVASQKADDIDAGQQLEYGTDYMIDDKTLTLTTVGDSSKQLYVYRETPTDLVVVFEDSSIIRAKDFNTNNEQVAAILEELSDYLILHKISDEKLAFVQNSVEQITEDLTEVQHLLSQVISVAQQALEYLNEINDIKEYVADLSNTAQQSAEMSNEYMQQSQTNAEINTAKGYNANETYSFPDVVAYTDGYVYRCIGQNIIGEKPPDSNNWVRIQTTYDDFFEIDMEGNLTPTLNPIYSEMFVLDTNMDIMPR